MAALGLQLPQLPHRIIRVSSSVGPTEDGNAVTADRKERLERWLQGMGHRHCNLKLERAPRGTDALGYGMVAGPGGIESGSVIVQVPRQAFLSEETAGKCPFVGPLVQNSQLTSWQVMCMHLLCERARGKESFWYPYISMLPSKLELANFYPLLWPQNVRKEWLAGSPMFDRIETRLTMCKEDYEAMLAAGANELLPSGGFVTEAAVQWAAAILLSRAFSLEIDEQDSIDNGASVVLVPWADMLNHSSSAGKESCLVYDEDMKMGTLKAHKSYEEGDQVYDSFGPGLSGPQLLLDYGFVDEDNGNHVIDLPATVLGPVKSRANGALLGTLGLPVDGAVFSITPEGVDDSVLAWTRAAVATSQELRAAGWKEIVEKNSSTYHKASSAMVHFSQPISRENESEVLHRLIRACEELTKKYPTTLEQDVAQLAAGTDSSMKSPLPWARKQALRAIISEKKALKGAETVLLGLLEELRVGASPSVLCT